MSPKRWLAIGLAQILVALIVVGWLVSLRLQNRVSVVNRSGQPVRVVTVTVGGETIQFGDLKDGESVTSPHTIDGDGGFVFRAQLSDGTMVEQQNGYVTGGMFARQATFVIEPDGAVDFADGKRPY